MVGSGALAFYLMLINRLLTHRRLLTSAHHPTCALDWNRSRLVFAPKAKAILGVRCVLQGAYGNGDELPGVRCRDVLEAQQRRAELL
jgi:hypothetical protein